MARWAPGSLNDLWVLQPDLAPCQLQQFHWSLAEVILLQGVEVTKTDPYGSVNLALARDPISNELWYMTSDGIQFSPLNHQTCPFKLLLTPKRACDANPFYFSHH